MKNHNFQHKKIFPDLFDLEILPVTFLCLTDSSEKKYNFLQIK